MSISGTHTAFKCQAIFTKSKFKVRCVACYENQIIVACSDGLFRVYETQGHNYFVENIIQEVQFKECLQIEVIDSLKCLVGLIDGFVRVYDIQNGFKLVSEVARPNGASTRLVKSAHCFTLSRSDATKGSIYLCAAIKKSLLVFKWAGKHGDPSIGHHFEFLHEWILAEKIRTMSWSDRSVCVGFKNEYNLIRIRDGKPKDLFETGKSRKPVTAVLPNNEILLAKDKVSFVVDFNGRPAREQGLNWTEAPIAMCYAFPYVLAAVPSGVEICNLDTSTTTQMVELKNVTNIYAKSQIKDFGVQCTKVVVACERDVWELQEVNLIEQLHSLQEKNRFEEALKLANLFDENHFTTFRKQKHRILSKLHHDYAFHLFTNGSYELALEQFEHSRVNPRLVLSLYPEPDIRPAGQCQQCVRQHPIPITNVLEEGDSRRKLALQALLSYLERLRISIIHHTQNDSSARTSNKHEDWLSDWVVPGEMNLDVLVDTVLLKVYNAVAQDKIMKLLKSENKCDTTVCDQVLRFSNLFLERVFLCRSRGMHEEALNLLVEKIGTRVLQHHQLITETVKYLQELGQESMYKKLVLKYSAAVLKENADQGLRIFTGMDSDGKYTYNTPAIAFMEVINHLKKYDNGDLCISYLETLVHEHNCQQPKCHDELISLYLQRIRGEMTNQRENDEMTRQQWGVAVNDVVTLTRDSDNEKYKKGMKAYVTKLELKLGKRHVKLMFAKRARDDKYAYLPADYVALNKGKRKFVKAGMEPGILGKLRKKLLKFLQDSKFYTPNYLLSKKFRTGGLLEPLLEEKAIVLSRIPDHEEALRIYAYQLGSPSLAEDHCKRIWNEYHTPDKDGYVDPKLKQEAKDLYLTMLRVYLHPPKGPEGRVRHRDYRINEAMQLLANNADRLDPIKALELLPDNGVELSKCQPYFEATLRKLTARKRNSQVCRNLTEQEYLQVKGTLHQVQKPSVHVDDRTRCRICKGFIMTNAFYREPDSEGLAHYNCYHASNKNTGYGSSVFRKINS